MPQLIRYDLSDGCSPDGGFIKLRSVSGASPTRASYTWQVQHENGLDYGGEFDILALPTAEPLPDGKYTVQVVAVEETQVYTSAQRIITVSCGGTSAPRLILDSILATNETAAGGDGKVTAQASGGTGALTALLVETGQTQAVTAGQPFTFTGLSARASGTTYTVRVTDSGIPTPQIVQDTVSVGKPTARGCTDPTALNYNAGAGEEDGSCTYTPPTIEPFFNVPLLQSLRFAVRGGAGGHFDTYLFCEQPRPGQQKRPWYYQLVEHTDTVRVQVLTSYASVSATIYQHGGAAVTEAIALPLVRTLSGPATPLDVVLSQDPLTGTTRLRAAAGGALPTSLLGATRLTLGGAAGGTYRITQAVPGSVVALDDYLVLNRPWVAPGAGQVTATWLLIGPGFNVFEAELPLAGLAAAYYQVKLRATRPTWPTATADSEPIHLKEQHANTVAVDYRNGDNCFGLVFDTGITPRLRVLGTFFRQKNGGTQSNYTDSAERVTILSSTARRITTLETYGQPAYMHEKLYLGCRLDYLAVNGERQASPAAYETSDERTYPLSGGHADLQKVDFLGNGNGDDFGVSEDAPDNALALRGGGHLLLRGK